MNNFLEKGMKFPPQIDPVTGRFMVSEGKENIKESIYLILKTLKTERWLRPEFGSDAVRFTFMDMHTTMLHMLSQELINDIISNESRVTDVSVHFERADSEGCLYVYIDYTIRSENVPDNFVFPLYLSPAE